MRTSMVRMLAVWAAVLVLVGVPAAWSVARVSEAAEGRTLGQVQQSDGDDEELEERVAALETQVAELRTVVEELQGGGLADEAGPTRVPVVCGRPYGSWGAATADRVTVTLIQQADGAADDVVAVEGGTVVALEITLANNRDEALEVDPADFVVTDCEGETHAGMDDGGVEPALEAGQLGPGREARGWVTFVLPDGMQAAGFAYRLPSPGRSGAEVSCPLVDRDADPGGTGALGGAGCSARGGSAG